MSHEESWKRCEAVNFWSNNQCQNIAGHMGSHIHFDGKGTEGWGKPWSTTSSP